MHTHTHKSIHTRVKQIILSMTHDGVYVEFFNHHYKQKVLYHNQVMTLLFTFVLLSSLKTENINPTKLSSIIWYIAWVRTSAQINNNNVRDSKYLFKRDCQSQQSSASPGTISAKLKCPQNCILPFQGFRKKDL